MARFVQVDLESPDPTQAINAFLWNMNKARSLGFLPSSENMMAEHFFRGDVKLMFYSSAGGIISLAANDESLDADDSFEILEFALERLKARKKAKREAAALEALAQADRNPEGEKPQALSAEHESPVAEGDAPNPTP